MISIWIAAAIGAAASIFGGFAGNQANKSESSRNRDWQAQQYGQKWQVTMADMRKAGMNPMLAYSQGVGTAPSGSTAQMGDFGGGAAGNLIAQAGVRSAATKQTKAQTDLTIQSELKTKEEVTSAHQAARLAKMRADDYETAGDSIVGRQLITAIRSGKAGSKKLRDKPNARNRPNDRELEKIMSKALRRKAEREGRAVPRPRNKPNPSEYRRPKKGEALGYYFSRKGPKKVRKR